MFLFSTLIASGQIRSQFFDGIPMNSLPVTIGSGTNNIWQIGQPQKTLFSSASSTPNVIITRTTNPYPVGNTSSFTVFALPAQMNTPYVLQWKQKLDMDAKKDGGIIEFSNNSGTTWQNAHNNLNTYQFYGFQPANKDTINANVYCFSGRDTTWRDIWLCVKPAFATQNDTLLFRFTFKSDSTDNQKEGWMIDNFTAHQTILHPVKEISDLGDLVVYPNVTTGIINVEMRKRSDNDMISNIQLYNNEGKLVEVFGPNYTKVVLDISRHKPGLYYLNVTINKKMSRHKIVYEKN